MWVVAAMNAKIDFVLEHLAVENRHDMDAMLATLSDEDPVRDEVSNKCYRGLKAVADRYGELWHSFPDFHVFPRRLIESADTVTMLADYSGTHLGNYSSSFGAFEPTKKTFKVRIVNVIDFKHDKILKETIFMDVLSQLRQLGLVPETNRVAQRTNLVVGRRQVEIDAVGLRS